MVYILSQDNWRVGISGLFASALGLASFKNVFWSSPRNPGNKFYYNCMDVSNNTDPNVPWSLAYRYTGYQNQTKSGHQCLSWYDLEWHWKFPESDLERDGCRSLANSQYGEGKPFCFYEGSVDTPESEWRWEECDIPECEVDCNRPGLGTDPTLPPCQEYTEPDPQLQAVVSLMSGGGVGLGDSLDTINTDIIMKTCRADGLLLHLDKPMTVTPLQLQRMASSCKVGCK